MQRGQQLDELDDKSLRLEESASRFQKNANKVHWLYRCRNYRNLAIIFFLLAVCVMRTSASGYKYTPSLFLIAFHWFVHVLNSNLTVAVRCYSSQVILVLILWAAGAFN